MKTPKRTDIIAECYERSLTLLRKNCDRNRVIAAARSNKAADRGYAAVFGRDAAIYSLGMLASEDRELIRKAKASLLTLAKHQAPNGQIPKYVKPESREVDFWYSDCIDATLWWLIAVDFSRARSAYIRLSLLSSASISFIRLRSEAVMPPYFDFQL